MLKYLPATFPATLLIQTSRHFLSHRSYQPTNASPWAELVLGKLPCIRLRCTTSSSLLTAASSLSKECPSCTITVGDGSAFWRNRVARSEVECMAAARPLKLQQRYPVSGFLFVQWSQWMALAPLACYPCRSSCRSPWKTWANRRSSCDQHPLFFGIVSNIVQNAYGNIAIPWGRCREVRLESLGAASERSGCESGEVWGSCCHLRANANVPDFKKSRWQRLC